MTAQDIGPRAWGGGWLAGDKIVRMVFVDEAGIANPSHEPFVTVGGVIVDADKQWKSLEVKLVNLAKRHVPEGVELENFCFHATDLFSGGKFFPKDKYERWERWAILEELCKIPKELDLWLCWGYERRDDFEDRDGVQGWLWAQAHAFHGVLQVSQDFLRKNAPPHEVASVIVEDNHQARRLLRAVLANSQQRDANLHLHAHERDQLWLTRIMGEPSFQQKSHRSPLQLADICAYVIKRKLMGRPDIEPFWNLIKGSICNLTKLDEV